MTVGDLVMVNQLVFPDPQRPCKMCEARHKIQAKYLDQVPPGLGDHGAGEVAWVRLGGDLGQPWGNLEPLWVWEKV